MIQMVMTVINIISQEPTNLKNKKSILLVRLLLRSNATSFTEVLILISLEHMPEKLILAIQYIMKPN
jgi:hypothetical protein